MEENCREIDCPKVCDFICGCDSEVRLCHEHYLIHLKEPGNHHLQAIIEAVQKKMSRASQEVESLDTKAALAFDQGKQMIQEILEKVNLISENMSERQMKVIELANSGRLGPEVEREILDEGEVTVSLNRSEAFTRAIQRHFRIEDGDEMEAAFRGDVNTLTTSLNETSEVMID